MPRFESSRRRPASMWRLRASSSPFAKRDSHRDNVRSWVHRGITGGVLLDDGPEGAQRCTRLLTCPTSFPYGWPIDGHSTSICAKGATSSISDCAHQLVSIFNQSPALSRRGLRSLRRRRLGRALRSSETKVASTSTMKTMKNASAIVPTSRDRQREHSAVGYHQKGAAKDDGHEGRPPLAVCGAIRREGEPRNQKDHPYEVMRPGNG